MISVDRRLFYNVDWVLLLAVGVITAIGVATIMSATHSSRFSGIYLKQVYAVCLGAFGMVIAASIDYRRLADRAVLLYVMSVLALVYVLRFAPVIGRASCREECNGQCRSRWSPYH